MKTWRWMLTMVAAGSLVAACSVETTTDDDDGTSGGGGNGGSATTTSVTGVTGSTTGVTSTTTGQPMGCYRDDQALNAPGSVPETGKMDCTAAQVDGFFSACFDGGDCTAFQMDMANEACLGCLLGGGGMHYPPLLVGNEGANGSTVYVNVYACESLAQGMNNCAESTADLSHCVNTSCETCASDAEEQVCTQEAQAGICSQFMVPMECAGILQTDLTMLSPECAGTDFQSLYTSAANYICGAGAN